MNPTFETIGLEVPSEKAFNYLAERAGDQGEATQLNRRGAVLHGRCWKWAKGSRFGPSSMSQAAATFSTPTVGPASGLVTSKQLVPGR